ncbi:hypothetical protein ACV07N_13465 [Roseivirga echinicomitans]
MKAIGRVLSKEELLTITNVIWQCECAVNDGAWESKSMKEANNTAHWACENADILAFCSATIDNRKYKVNIKRRN